MIHLQNPNLISRFNKNGSVINLQSFTLVTNSEVVGVDSENLTTLVQNIIDCLDSLYFDATMSTVLE